MRSLMLSMSALALVTLLGCGGDDGGDVADNGAGGKLNIGGQGGGSGGSGGSINLGGAGNGSGGGAASGSGGFIGVLLLYPLSLAPVCFA